MIRDWGLQLRVDRWPSKQRQDRGLAGERLRGKRWLIPVSTHGLFTTTQVSTVHYMFDTLFVSVFRSKTKLSWQNLLGLKVTEISWAKSTDILFRKTFPNAWNPMGFQILRKKTSEKKYKEHNGKMSEVQTLCPTTYCKRGYSTMQHSLTATFS